MTHVTFDKQKKKTKEEKDVAVAAAAKLIFRPIGHGQLRYSTTKKKISNSSSSSSSPSVASNLTNWYEPKKTSHHK